MTPEFGAASQLEKIDMLDFAEFVAINKFDRKGAADALRDVAKQVQRNKEAWTAKTEDMPVFGTMAASPWPMPEVSTTIRSKPVHLQAASTSGSAWLISLPKSRVARLRM